MTRRLKEAATSIHLRCLGGIIDIAASTFLLHVGLILIWAHFSGFADTGVIRWNEAPVWTWLPPLALFLVVIVSLALGWRSHVRTGLTRSLNVVVTEDLYQTLRRSADTCLDRHGRPADSEIVANVILLEHLDRSIDGYEPLREAR